jgi:hypothetical protein
LQHWRAGAQRLSETQTIHRRLTDLAAKESTGIIGFEDSNFRIADHPPGGWPFTPQSQVVTRLQFDRREYLASNVDAQVADTLAFNRETFVPID